MLTGLGDPMPTVGRIDGRTSRIVKQAQTCEMELAILDEFHHLFAAEDPSVSLNWLKSLVSKLQSPLVIAGISTIRDLINSDTQLSRRFEVRLEMRYLPLTSASESDFRSFLTAFAEGVRTKLHLAEMPDVTHPPTMMSIYALTRACPSAVATFFFHSGKKAAEKGSAERMLLDDFVNAAREPFFDSFRVTTKNPFVMDPPAVFSELRAARLI